MRIKELIVDDISRRGFLSGAAAAAGLAASGLARAGAGGQHLPVEFSDEAGKEWTKVDPKTAQVWRGRQIKLQTRVQGILTKLLTVVNEHDKSFLNGVTINVPVHMALYDWAHVGKDKKIEIDLGTYWDLSDDAIAYTVAHEMGHIVLDGRGIHKFGKSWDTPALKRAKVQSELDADAYGAEIAFKSGYSPKRAFDQMNAEAKSWRYNPNVKGQDFYPDYPMRQKSLDQTIQRLKSELDAAKQGNDAQAAQQELNSLRQQQSQQQSTSQPQNDQQLAAAKQSIFNHIFRGIGTLSA